MPWFRLYHEARRDDKLRTLADDEHRVWFALLCFAAEQPDRGTIAMADHYLLAVEVAHADEELLDRVLQKLLRLRIIEESDGSFSFCNFIKRQHDKPSDMPEETRRRQAKHRETERESNGHASQAPNTETVTPPSRAVTRSHAIEREREGELERERPNENGTPGKELLREHRQTDDVGGTASAGAPDLSEPLPPKVTPKRPVKQATPAGHSLLEAVLEITNGTLEGASRRKEELNCDELLRRCRGDEQEAIDYFRHRWMRGDSPLLRYVAADYTPGWRNKANARASPNGTGRPSAAQAFAAIARGESP